MESKYIKDKNIFIETNNGYKLIHYIHKTPLVNNITCFFEEVNSKEQISLTVADYHLFITEDNQEIEAVNIVDHKIKGKNGLYKLTNKIRNPKQHLYDFTVEDHLYYANGLLSHNSGKSITTATYLCWLYNFKSNFNIGIVSCEYKNATEILYQIKEMFLGLPVWLKNGVNIWNIRKIGTELKTRIIVDVPSGTAFRGFSMNVILVDECAFIKNNMWEEFKDSVFPAQEGLAEKKNIIISTANGLNHFYDIVTRTKKLETKKDTRSKLVQVHWNEPPRYEGGKIITPEEFKKRTISKYGEIYFNQNFANEFVGSSETLLPANIINKLEAIPFIDKWDNKLQIYELPQQDHVYILGLDSSKDGKDFTAIQILDVTSTPFKQVASCKLQINYLLLPSFIDEWARKFNYAMIVVENNEGSGQSIVDSLKFHFDYPNIYSEYKKTFGGFRTTSKSRKSVLSLLKGYASNGNLIVNDFDTIEELKRFELVNGKYQASQGHDDLIMSLAMCFVPFINVKKFDNYNSFLNSLGSQNVNTAEWFSSFDSIGFADLDPIGFYEE